jgi:hypothetical protein
MLIALSDKLGYPLPGLMVIGGQEIKCQLVHFPQMIHGLRRFGLCEDDPIPEWLAAKIP